MSEIMRCVFEKREPGENTLSRRYGWRTRWLPLPSVEPLPYPEWRAYFVDPTKPDFAFEHMQAHNV